MDNDEFLKELNERFYNKNTFLKPRGSAIRDSVLDTIKSLLSKKNLVIISKSELDKLKQ